MVGFTRAFETVGGLFGGAGCGNDCKHRLNLNAALYRVEAQLEARLQLTT